MTSLSRAALGALALTVVTVAGASAQSVTRIGYVNSQKLLPQAPGFADAQAQVETESEGVKAQEQKMSDSLNVMVAAYQKISSTLTATQKATREAAIRAKQQEYQQRASQLEGRAQSHQAELIQPIMEQIRGIIEQMRIDGGYTVIFDAGSQSGVVVAIDTTLDLTDKVIAKLAEAGPPPKGTAKPAVKPGTKPVTPGTKPTGISRPPSPRGR